MWDCILSILVIIHLCSEYVHYVLEWIAGKREKDVLADIQKHRRRSKKTEMLQQIQKDIATNTKSLDVIKEKLGI